jgi:hypothetical protein
VKNKVVLPHTVDLRIARKGDRAKFSYEETFPVKKIVKTTFDLIKDAIPGVDAKITKSGRGIRLSGTVDYRTLGNMMTGEFLIWSTIGDMTLRDMFIRSWVAGRRPAVTLGSPETPRAVKLKPVKYPKLPLEDPKRPKMPPTHPRGFDINEEENPPPKAEK